MHFKGIQPGAKGISFQAGRALPTHLSFSSGQVTLAVDKPDTGEAHEAAAFAL
jgi:hypothetical protein